jgi:small GTP-binding protein
MRRGSFAQEITRKVILLGNSGVGKTSLANWWMHSSFDEYARPTFGASNAYKEVMIDDKLVRVTIWDTAGQDEYDRLRPLSYSGANAILLCFALDSKQSFVNLTERWIGEVKHYCRDAKIILIGTKSDLRVAGNPAHVSDDEARQFVAEQKCDAFIPCSPKTGEGVDHVFPAAAKACNQKKKKKCLLV